MREWRPILLIFLIGFLVYARSLANGFCWDDEALIIGNSLIRSWHTLPEIFSKGMWAGTGSYYRPLTIFSYLLDYQLWGLSAWAFHLTNILIHLAASIGLYLLLRWHFSSRTSLVCALLFCVHPAISTDVLAVFARNSTLECFTVFGLLGVQRVNSKPIWGAWAVFCFALGLLSKESEVIFPALVLLYAWSFRLLKAKRMRILCGALWAMLFVYLGLRWMFFPIQPIPPLSMIASQSYSVRAWTAFEGLLRYLGLVFAPVFLHMERHFVRDSLSAPLPWVSLALFTGLLALGFKLRRKRPVLLFGLLWFLGTLFPVSNLTFPMPYTIQESLLYIPIIGWIWIAADALERYWGRKKRIPREAMACVSLVLLAFSARTFARSLDWKDALTLYAHDLRYSPNSFVLRTNYGTELFRSGRIDEAREAFQQALEISPNYSTAMNNLGVALEAKGDAEGAETEYMKAVAIGDYPLAYFNLARVLARRGRRAEAREVVEKGLTSFPYDAKLRRLAEDGV